MNIYFDTNEYVPVPKLPQKKVEYSPLKGLVFKRDPNFSEIVARLKF